MNAEQPMVMPGFIFLIFWAAFAFAYRRDGETAQRVVEERAPSSHMPALVLIGDRLVDPKTQEKMPFHWREDSSGDYVRIGDEP